MTHTARPIFGLAIVALSGCLGGSASPPPATGTDSGSDSGATVTVATTIEPTTPTAATDAMAGDFRCAWTAEVAANQPITLITTIDGVPEIVNGSAYTMALDAAEVAVRCETGPMFGTEDLLATIEGQEDPDWRYGFADPTKPAVLPPELVVDGGAVLITWLDPLEAQGAILFPSSAIASTEAVLDYPSSLVSN